MQIAVVFAALICAAAAQTVVNSNRLGGNWAYSVNTPAVSTYAANWAPHWNNWNGAQWNGASWTAPVAVARSSLVTAHTPASTYKTVAGVSPIYYNNAWGYPSHNWNTVATW